MANTINLHIHLFLLLIFFNIYKPFLKPSLSSK
nr:MAG TPA: hypothetical protein [Bacteriophage sp.]DAR93898.1 MAG TPA: hypothetical protein [Caudoviricetes sp.]DAY37535.1 MAG TPA: hypothetical protein [Caudoviricetes sp.]